MTGSLCPPIYVERLMKVIDFKKPGGTQKYLAFVAFKDGTTAEHIIEGINPEEHIVWLVHDDDALTLVSAANIKSISVEPIKELQ